MNSQNLAPGVYYLPQFVPASMQEQILIWYQDHLDWFYCPKYKSKFPMSVKMCCLGKHWSAEDNKYYPHRIDHDGRAVLPLPEWLSNFGQEIVSHLYPHHAPALGLDLAVVNAYTSEARLGMHQDNAESGQTITSGYPIISISLGLPAVFKYRIGGKVLSLELKNADVICFGDQNRLMYHGITSVASKPSVPTSTFADMGMRVNFTLRKQ